MISSRLLSGREILFTFELPLAKRIKGEVANSWTFINIWVVTSVVRTTMSVSAISADSGPGKPHIRPDTCPLVQSTHVRSPSVGVYL